MRAFRHIVHGTLAAGLSLALGAGSATAESFKDWEVSCPPGQDALCTMESAALNKDREPESVLRITRTPEGEVREIALKAPAPVLTSRFPLLLRVDSKKPIRLEHNDGIEVGDLGTLRIYGSKEITALLKQMGPGKRIRLEFYNDKDDYRFAIFSLVGFSDALSAGAPMPTAEKQDGSDATPPLPEPAPRAQEAAEAAPAPDHAEAEPAGAEQAAHVPTPPVPQSRPRRTQTTELRPPPSSLDGSIQVSGGRLPEGTVFTPLGELPPAGDCYDHKRSTSDTGRFLGWISTNLCR